MSDRIRIDLGELEYAFEDASFDSEHFLDLRTGEVVTVTRFDGDDESRERIDADPSRYVRVPPADSRAGYRDMAEFAAGVEEPRLRELLDLALRGKGAFRRFKDVLGDFPAERQEWFLFQRRRVLGRVTAWLDGLGIEWDGAVPDEGPRET